MDVTQIKYLYGHYRNMCTFTFTKLMLSVITAVLEKFPEISRLHKQIISKCTGITFFIIVAHVIVDKEAEV